MPVFIEGYVGVLQSVYTMLPLLVKSTLYNTTEQKVRLARLQLAVQHDTLACTALIVQ